LFYESHQFDQVADRLAPLVLARGLTSFMDYYYLLKYSDDSGEWLRVMDALAVQETYFWREIDQIRAVVNHVIPRIEAGLKGRPLKIWSAPCASGEEPLTIAMVLEESGWFDRLAIEIVGSDASPAAIAKATAGRYGGRSFRNLPPRLHDRYFTPLADHWQVDPQLHRRVTYDVVNLVVPQDVARHAASPIIVCRNLFIYFSDRSIRTTVRAFAQSMPDPGFLCIGASESLLRFDVGFELQEIGGAFMYVKQPVAQPSAAVLAMPDERV
jgi:chemotaxis protein methyltransferase CheR